MFSRARVPIIFLLLALLLSGLSTPVLAQTWAAPRVVVAVPGAEGDLLAARLRAALTQAVPEAGVVRYTGPVTTPQAAKRIGLHFGAALIVWQAAAEPETLQVTTEWAGAPQPLQTGRLPIPAGDSRAAAAAVRALAGAALSRMGDCAAGLPQLDRAVALAAPDWAGLAEVRYFRGMCAIFGGDLEAARADFEAVIAAGHAPWYVAHAAAQLYSGAGEIEAALAATDQALALLPDNAALLAERADLHVRSGNPAAALADYDRALALVPDDPALRLARARLLTLEGDYAAALADLDAALEGDPFNRDELRFQRGLVQLYRGEYAAAVRDLSAYTARRPEDPAGWINLGQAHEWQGELFSAMQAYESALAADPAATHLYTTLARLYYDGAAAFDPDSQQAADYLALSLDAATSALEAFGDDVTALLYRGLVHLARHDNEYALEDFSRAVDLHPEFAAARYNRAIVYTRLAYAALDEGERAGLLRAALADYAALFGLDFAAYNYLLPYAGYLHAELGDYEAAAEHFAAYDDLYPDQPLDASGALYRGATYRALGQTEQALAAYRVALDSPDTDTACAARLAGGLLEGRAAGRYAIGAAHLAAYLEDGCPSGALLRAALEVQIAGWRALAAD